LISAHQNDPKYINHIKFQQKKNSNFLKTQAFPDYLRRWEKLNFGTATCTGAKRVRGPLDLEVYMYIILLFKVLYSYISSSI
jgi:hypothetical protein